MKVRSLLVILFLTPATQADVIAVDGRPPIIGATLLALRNGQLLYRSSGGREAARSIDQIEYVQVSGWNVFNAAEKQQRDKQYRDAALNYEKALTDMGESSGRFDRALLARCRLVRVYDADGQFDRAVRVYLEVLDTAEGGAYVDLLRPQRIPELGSTFLQPAREMLDRSIQKHDRDVIAKSLRAWRATWPGAATQPAIEKPATQPAKQNQHEAQASVIPNQHEAQASDISLSEIRTLIEKERYRTALESISKSQSQSTQPELFYWQARALLGLQTENKDEAAINQKRAGLALMRVVIHYPEHAYAPECLYRAGEISLSAGDRGQAAVLWSGLLDRYSAAQPWADRARQSLQQLNNEKAAAGGANAEK